MHFSKDIPEFLEFDIFKDYKNISAYVTCKKNPAGMQGDFNIGFSGDSNENIIKNRDILAKSLRLKFDNFVFQTQIHKTNVCCVDQSFAGRGFYSKDTAVADTDIMITNTRGLYLVTRSADCVPVLLYDKQNCAVAAVHSGREDTCLNAVGAAIDALRKNFGSLSEDIVAAIGPAVCGKCYQVDYNCGAPFLDMLGNCDSVVFDKVNNKIYLDLKAIIKQQLISAGVCQNNIEISHYCTKCNGDLFFSARNSEKGRFCAIIGINNF